MKGRRPQLNLRVASAVEGRPGQVIVSPDATRVFVFDLEAPRMTILGAAGLEFIRTVTLPSSPRGGSPLLASHLDDLCFIGGPDSLTLFDMASEQFRGSLPCSAQPCDLVSLPDERHILVAVSSGHTGYVELLEAGRGASEGRLLLPWPPVPGTLVFSPERGLGAVVVRSPEGAGESLVCWSLGPFSPLWTAPVGAGTRSVDFDPDGLRIYAACHGDSEVLEVDVALGKITRRLRMAGRPFQVRAERSGRTVWVLCEKLGSVTVVDPRHGLTSAKLPLRGVAAPLNRLAVSPEGKLAVVPQREGASVALLNSDTRSRRYGEVEDRLELGRSVACAAWSPLGDEVFVTDDVLGAVLSLVVDRGDLTMHDTVEFIAEKLRKAASRGRRPAEPKNPLFPP